MRSGVRGVVAIVVVVVLLLDGRTGRFGEIEEKREEYVRDGEVEERSHDVGRICGLVGKVSDLFREGVLTIYRNKVELTGYCVLFLKSTSAWPSSKTERPA